MNRSALRLTCLLAALAATLSWGAAIAFIPPVAGIFFDSGATKPGPGSERVLGWLIESYRKGDMREFRIEAHADRAGNPDYNLRLSRLRAEAVRDYLIARGVARSAILSLDYYGETRPMVETGDEVAEPQNRRVDVQYGPWTPPPASPRAWRAVIPRSPCGSTLPKRREILFRAGKGLGEHRLPAPMRGDTDI